MAHLKLDDSRRASERSDIVSRKLSGEAGLAPSRLYQAQNADGKVVARERFGAKRQK